MRQNLSLSSTTAWLVACMLCACQGGTEQSEVLPGVESIVFAKRAFIEESGKQNVSDGAGRVVDYLRYTPGGGVFVLSPPTPDGKLRELTTKFKGVDISGLDL